MSFYFNEPFFSFSDINRLFDDFHRLAGQGQPENQVQRSDSASRQFRPRMDIHENIEQNVVTATFELPGLTKENINIDIHNNRLVISGETTQSKDLEDKGYVHRERWTGKFSRSLPLPMGTKPEEIKASMESGVLRVTFPKTPAEQAPKRVTIS